MIRTVTQGTRYAYRYLTHKFDAFQSFGEVKEGLLPHSIIRPVPTYSPWRSDERFHAAYQLISPNTLVDLYRCYELWSLVAESAKLPAGDFLEVGVWRGGTGCLIAKRAQLERIPGTVYLCDTFDGVVKAGSRDRHYEGGEHSDTSSDIVKALAQSLSVTNIEILKGIFPEATGHIVQDCSFRFCHIDVDVYESAKEVLEWVWPRLVAGGIVVFDDYGSLSTGGITELVNEQRAQADRLMLHNLNGHAVFIKLP